MISPKKRLVTTPYRHTEILIAVASYNEDKTLHARTLHSIVLNVRKTQQSKYWRQNSEDGKPG